MFMKKFFTFIIILIPWFLGSIIPVDYSYYREINLPSFAPPTIFYNISWTIIYILISISIICLFDSYSFKTIPKTYKITLLINYLFNQSYTLVFFGLKSNFLGFISCVGTLISTLFLFNETYELKPKCCRYLIPYFLLSVVAVILSFTIYIMNI